MMTSLQRRRPLLGTFVTITCDKAANGDHEDSSFRHALLTEAFQEGERLQKIFSFHDPESTLSRFNKIPPTQRDLEPWPREFLDLLEKAKKIQRTSKNCFWPFASASDDADGDETGRWDLSGIAKGFIVDRLCEFLLARDPELRGSINAGGDLRFFGRGDGDKNASLRLGPPGKPLLRRLSPRFESLASSSPAVAFTDPLSSTRYDKTLASDLSPFHTACVSTAECAIADALTKVALFGEAALRREMAREFNAEIFIFDADGDLQAQWGPS
jgi:thiamine biosynthesis lipoprotein